MEDDREAAAAAARAAPSSVAPLSPPSQPQQQPPPPPPAPSSSSAPRKDDPASPPAAAPRLRFSVELRPGETTIVSWKRLLRDSGKDPAPHPRAAAAEQPLADKAAPAVNELKDEVPPSNRFSAVIEKIERLYMGEQSSDEGELDDIPDDDQYDTEDSFIDDAELDEYFHVDKISTKHNGYFVNKGKLEQLEANSLPQEAPKKRRRKDSTKIHGEGSRTIVPTDPANVGNLRNKVAARGPPAARRRSVPAKAFAHSGEHHNEEYRVSKYNSKGIAMGYKRKSTELSIRPGELSIVGAPYKDFLSRPSETKDVDKHKAGDSASKDSAHRSRASDSYDPLHHPPHDKGSVELQSKKLLNGEAEMSSKVRHKDRYGSNNLAAMNSSINSYPMAAMQQTSTRVKEGSTIRPKGTTLERAIRDLEKIVAECRPPSFDVQEVDPSVQGIKRRLPQEVKQKLAKVARLSASQGKISEDELIDRLMGILGHLIQRKTLKKNMREMVELGLSAKQQKADKFQQIKREVNEMIRARVAQSKSKIAEQQDGTADDAQQVNNDELRTLKGRYNMDAAIEDKICELYDLYVEGMDEDKGPQSRKLYVQLAELWPSGSMDNVGIKDAINRSKERKRALYRQHKVRDVERIKRKRLASAARVDKPNPSAQVRSGQEKLVTNIDSSAKVFSYMDELNSYPPGSTGKSAYSAPLATDPGLQHGSKNPDKVRAVSTSANPDDTSKTLVDVKKS